MAFRSGMAYAKEDPDEAEEKFDEKDDQLAWADDSEDEDKSSRVLGWRDGEPLTREDIHEILRREPAERIRYEELRKLTSSKKRKEEAADPLEDLPPEWQAVYALAPSADPQVAWARAKMAEDRHKRQKKESLDERLQWESRPGETVEQETARLKAEALEDKKVVSANKKVIEEWDKKLEEYQKSLKEAHVFSRTFLRAFEKATYDHSVAKGQLRSSEMYFHFLTQDTEQNTSLQVSTLERSCALMDKTMDLLRGHIRALQEVANMSSASELDMLEPFSPSPQLGNTPGGRTPAASPMHLTAKLKAMKVPPVSPSLRD